MFFRVAYKTLKYWWRLHFLNIIDPHCIAETKFVCLFVFVLKSVVDTCSFMYVRLEIVRRILDL